MESEDPMNYARTLVQLMGITNSRELTELIGSHFPDLDEEVVNFVVLNALPDLVTFNSNYGGSIGSPQSIARIKGA